MPKHHKSKRLGKREYYTRMELKKLYLHEGYSLEESRKKAHELYWAIIGMNEKQAYSWNKARELEIPFGVGEALHQLCDCEDFSGEAHWCDAGIISAGKSKTKHYEKLRSGVPSRQKR